MWMGDAKEKIKYEKASDEYTNTQIRGQVEGQARRAPRLTR